MIDLIADVIIAYAIIFAAGSWLGGMFGSHVISRLFR